MAHVSDCLPARLCELFEVCVTVSPSLQYFIPLVVLSFCYCRVGCEMWGSRVPGNADNQRDAVLLNNKRKVRTDHACRTSNSREVGDAALPHNKRKVRADRSCRISNSREVGDTALPHNKRKVRADHSCRTSNSREVGALPNYKRKVRTGDLCRTSNSREVEDVDVRMCTNERQLCGYVSMYTSKWNGS